MGDEDHGELMRAFWTDGFAIMHGLLSEEQVEQVRGSVESLMYSNSPLPGFLGRPMSYDDKRFRAAFSPRAIFDEVRTQFQAQVEKCDHAWRCQVFAVVKTEPNADEQEPHKDFDGTITTPALKECNVQAGMIVSLMGAEVTVYKACYYHLIERKRMYITLPPGSAIIYRGDLFHNDREYRETNYYLHTLIGLRSDPLLQYIPILSTPDIRMCRACNTRMPNKAAENHFRFCEKNPLRVRQNERRRALWAMPMKCQLCKVEFPNQRQYTRHQASCRQRSQGGKTQPRPLRPNQEED